ncbi:MAG: hypothetical protein AB8B60_09535 [Sulfitobacter sp.]
MLQDVLFQSSGLSDPRRCCAALNNNHRCTNEITDAGDGIICDTHAAQIRDGRPVRIYKASTYRDTVLGKALAALRDGQRAKTAKTPETGSNDQPSWFAKLFTPQGFGSIMFVLAVYLTEVIELTELGIPKSVALGSFDAVRLAFGNILPVLLITLIAGLSIASIIVVGIGIGILVTQLWQAVWGYGRLYTIFAVRRAGVEFSHRQLRPRWVNLLQVSPYARAAALIAHDARGVQRQEYFERKKAQINADLRPRLQALPARHRAARAALWSRMRVCWNLYFGRIWVRNATRSAVNLVQLLTIMVILAGTLFVSKLVATASAARVAEIACSAPIDAGDSAPSEPVTAAVFGKVIPVPSAVEFIVQHLTPPIETDEPKTVTVLGYDVPVPQIELRIFTAVSKVFFPVDCGYLVLNKRRLDVPSRLVMLADPPRSADAAQGQRLHSERVIYLGDYGDWAVVAPTKQPRERVMVRRTEIMEFSAQMPNRGAPAAAPPQASQALLFQAVPWQPRRISNEIIALAEILAVARPHSRHRYGPRVAQDPAIPAPLSNLEERLDEIAQTNSATASRDEIDALRALVLGANSPVESLQTQVSALSAKLGALDAARVLQHDALLRADKRDREIMLRLINTTNAEVARLLRQRGTGTDEDDGLYAQTLTLLQQAMDAVDQSPKVQELRDQMAALESSLITLTDAVKAAPDGLSFPPPAIIAARRSGLLDTRRGAGFRQCLSNRPAKSAFVYFQSGRAESTSDQVTNALQKIEERLRIDARLKGTLGSKAYVFFSGSASAPGNRDLNTLLAERRADWVERVWSRSLKSRRLGQKALYELDIETVAFGEGEALPVVHEGKRHSPRAVEVFVCEIGR